MKKIFNWLKTKITKWNDAVCLIKKHDRDPPHWY